MAAESRLTDDYYSPIADEFLGPVVLLHAHDRQYGVCFD